MENDQQSKIADRAGDQRARDAELRLPKWAQSELWRLRKNLEQAEHRLLAAFGQQETSIEVEPYRVNHDEHSGRLFLPDRTIVRFTLPAGIVDVGIRRGQVEVMAHGVSDFVVKPNASNVIHCGFATIAKATE